jgi:hypothetical protein
MQMIPQLEFKISLKGHSRSLESRINRLKKLNLTLINSSKNNPQVYNLNKIRILSKSKIIIKIIRSNKMNKIVKKTKRKAKEKRI